MLRFLLSRLGQTVLTLLAIYTVTFLMVKAAPGDPFTDERQASPEVIKNLKAYYGLDKPVIVQYFLFLGRLVTFDMPPSMKHPGRDVGDFIAEAFPNTVAVGLSALAIALLVGIPIGVITAVKRNTWLDYLPMTLAMVGICLPTFVLGPILGLVFGLHLGWFNVNGWNDLPADLVLPALTLGLFYASYIARLSRGGMLEILTQDFVRTAQAKGVSPSRLILRHTLRGGLLPVIAFLGPTIAHLLSGSFVVEKIFRIPGLGTHFLNGAFSRDISMILGTVLFFAAIIVVLNFLADIVQALMNPRVRITE